MKTIHTWSFRAGTCALMLFTGLLVSLLAGCQHAPQKMESGSNMEAIEMDEVETDPQEETPSSLERKLIKEGSLTFETASLSETRRRVFEVVEKYEGYIASDRTYSYANKQSNTLLIRVPAEHFDVLLSEATQGIDRIDEREVQVKDVTEEFYDVQARLKTKKELEARYLSLLSQAKSVSEILEIEKQAGELRSDIESVEGRLKYLQNQVSLSTLRMTFYVKTSQPTAFGKEFRNGFKQGWENLIWTLVGLVNVWPFLFIIVLVVLGIRRWRRRQK